MSYSLLQSVRLKVWSETFCFAMPPSIQNSVARDCSFRKQPKHYKIRKRHLSENQRNISSVLHHIVYTFITYVCKVINSWGNTIINQDYNITSTRLDVASLLKMSRLIVFYSCWKLEVPQTWRVVRIFLYQHNLMLISSKLMTGIYLEKLTCKWFCLDYILHYAVLSSILLSLFEF